MQCSTQAHWKCHILNWNHPTFPAVSIITWVWSINIPSSQWAIPNFPVRFQVTKMLAVRSCHLQLIQKVFLCTSHLPEEKERVDAWEDERPCWQHKMHLEKLNMLFQYPWRIDPIPAWEIQCLMSQLTKWSTTALSISINDIPVMFLIIILLFSKTAYNASSEKDLKTKFSITVLNYLPETCTQKPKYNILWTMFLSIDITYKQIFL